MASSFSDRSHSSEGGSQTRQDTAESTDCPEVQLRNVLLTLAPNETEPRLQRDVNAMLAVAVKPSHVDHICAQRVTVRGVAR